MRSFMLAVSVAVCLIAVFPPSTQATSPVPCSNAQRLAGTGPFCYAPSQFTRYARGLPFAASNPAGIVWKAARLRPVRLLVGRTSYPPSGVKTYPIGPPQSMDVEYGWASAPQASLGPPQRQATYVSVIEYPLSQTGRPRVWRVRPGGQWAFSADVPRQNMTINVRSDGPRAVVSAIGRALFRAESRLPRKPSVPERVYVTAPRHLHSGRPTVFWVLVAPRFGTKPMPAYDFDFTLGGGWSRPRTETPDGTQACGGDNVAGQPTDRRGRWVFHWGDCYELGLILTPHGTGLHTLTINGYSVPITAKGRLDYSHEKLAPGSGYRWRGMVRTIAAASPSSASSTSLLTVHQAIWQCTIPDGSSPHSYVAVWGQYRSSRRSAHDGTLHQAPGGRWRGPAVVRFLASIPPPRPSGRYADVFGFLTCPSVGHALLTAERWTPAPSHPPSLQVYPVVHPPARVASGQPAVFVVSTRLGPHPTPVSGFAPDFRLTGAWERQAVRTPDGSQACGGEILPQQPTLHHGYWSLDVGSCRTTNLVLTPRGHGPRGLLVRPFAVPLNAQGQLIEHRRVLQPSHIYRWQGVL